METSRIQIDYKLLQCLPRCYRYLYLCVLWSRKRIEISKVEKNHFNALQLAICDNKFDLFHTFISLGQTITIVILRLNHSGIP
ncbi:unnamed protein product [Schistosoma mansoni]|uniref:Smp_205210 n=1 Tax=Schistosoma mansoni TaxID=6183 RepID=UPI00022C87E6|nr:unnamed protein product [Schistosoma mansoni]|eukprot:XP_018644686.1 unnamed protein product [Schistosoma mansoni]